MIKVTKGNEQKAKQIVLQMLDKTDVYFGNAESFEDVKYEEFTTAQVITILAKYFASVSEKGQGEERPFNARVILPKPDLRDAELLSKIKGATKPGSKIKIFWTDTDQIDEGYIFATDECRWDEGDVFVHITEPYDGSPDQWKHMHELLDNDMVKRIEVAV